MTAGHASPNTVQSTEFLRSSLQSADVCESVGTGSAAPGTDDSHLLDSHTRDSEKLGLAPGTGEASLWVYLYHIIDREAVPRVVPGRSSLLEHLDIYGGPVKTTSASGSLVFNFSHAGRLPWMRWEGVGCGPSSATGVLSSSLGSLAAPVPAPSFGSKGELPRDSGQATRGGSPRIAPCAAAPGGSQRFFAQRKFSVSLAPGCSPPPASFFPPWSLAPPAHWSPSDRSLPNSNGTASTAASGAPAALHCREAIQPAPVVRVSVVALRLHKVIREMESFASNACDETWLRVHQLLSSFRTQMLWLNENFHHAPPAEGIELDVTEALARLRIKVPGQKKSRKPAARGRGKGDGGVCHVKLFIGER